MVKRATRTQTRLSKAPAAEEILLEEKQVPNIFNLSPPPCSWPLQPLRVLDQFRFFTRDGEGTDRTMLLDLLEQDLVEERQLHGCGLVLDPQLAAESLSKARAAAYARVRIHTVQDWVVEYSEPPTIWLVTPYAWYRLVSPAVEYIRCYLPLLKKIQLTQFCVSSLQANRDASFDGAVSSIVLAGKAAQACKRSSADNLAGHDPMQGLVDRSVNIQSLTEHAAFLAQQLTVYLGRHAGKNELILGLAELAGLSMDVLVSTSRPLLSSASDRPSADPSARPQPRTGFRVPSPMQAGVLMVWDFCQSYRELLRLPPFPLQRLEQAFLDAPDASGQPPGTSEIETANLHERVGAVGQGGLLKDVHLSMLRILEGVDVGRQEASTMAGNGSAAELGPQDVYRPLLGVTWPELVRIALQPLCSLEPLSAEATADQELKERDYGKLSAATRLVLLEALLHVSSDTEVMREHLQGGSMETVNQHLPRGFPIGTDDSGSRYFQLAAEAGIDRLFVEVREGLEEGQPGTWGWFVLSQIPALLQWLESGSRQEQELAEDIFETFHPQLQAAQAAEQAQASGSMPSIQLSTPQDGYAAAEPELEPEDVLRGEIISMLEGVRFWEKGTDWLKAHRAVLSDLETAQSGPDFARLLWLVEDLVYTDLLKGTGWGRKRIWFREQLETSKTVAQAAVLACQVAVHCRRPPEMGFMDERAFREGLKAAQMQPNFIPTKDNTAVLLRSGYTAHIQQARPPKDALSAALPHHWDFAEHVTVKEMKFVHGNWQRPSWQGRFVGGPAPPYPGADNLIVACLLLERNDKSRPIKAPATENAPGEINWEGFSFQTGFRQPHALFTNTPLSQTRTPTVGQSSLNSQPSSASTAAVPLCVEQESVAPKAEIVQQPRLMSEARAQHLRESELEQPATVKPKCAETVNANNPPPSELRSSTPVGLAWAKSVVVKEDNSAIAVESRPAAASSEAALTHPVAETAGQCTQRSTAAGLQPGALTSVSSSYASYLQLGGPSKAQQQPVQQRVAPARSHLLESLLPMGAARSIAQGKQQSGASVSGRSTPETRGSGSLRRSSRVRTEVSMADFESGIGMSDGAGNANTRSRRGSATELYQLGVHGAALAAQQAAAKARQTLPQVVAASAAQQEDDTALGALGSIEFWRKDRDLASVMFYVRENGPASVEYLLMPQLYAAGTDRSWAQGTVVKAPAYTNLARAVSIPNMCWYSGTLTASFTLLPASKRQPHLSGSTMPISQKDANASHAPGLSVVLQQQRTAPGTTNTALKAPAQSPSARNQMAATPSVQAGLGSALQPPESSKASPVASAACMPAGGNVPSCGGKEMLLRGMPGLRLGKLMAHTAAKAVQPDYGGSATPVGAGLSLQSGGVGGPLDPWKALSVRWDPGTLHGLATRVSPWEVLEDIGGAVRMENDKAYQALLAKQRADVAAREAQRASSAARQVAQASAADKSGLAPLANATHAAHQAALSQYHPQVCQGLPSASFGAMMHAAVAGKQLYTAAQPTCGIQPQSQHAQNAQLPDLSMRQQLYGSMHAGQRGAGQGTAMPFPAGALPAWQGQQVSQAGSQLHAAAGISQSSQRPPDGTAAIDVTDKARAEAQGSRKRKCSATEEKTAGKNSSNEGYRERWLAKKPRPNPNSWLSGFCSVCEQVAGNEGLLPCMGPCLRAFHPSCVSLTQQQQQQQQGAWFCPECDSGHMRCFTCGAFSNGFGDASIRKCSLGVCGRFYHVRCAEEAPLTQSARQGGHFRCPQHYCATCGRSGDGIDMAKCLRCPTAYHSMCMSGTSSIRLHAHSKAILCEKHKGEQPPGYVFPPWRASLTESSPQLPVAPVESCMPPCIAVAAEFAAK